MRSTRFHGAECRHCGSARQSPRLPLGRTRPLRRDNINTTRAAYSEVPGSGAASE